MFALHLCFDGNFINNSANVFEHFYPNQNLFLVNKESKHLKILRESENIKAFPLSKENYERIVEYVEKTNANSLVLHGLSRWYVPLVKFICARKKMKVYWIFWGYELYIALNQLGKYELVDDANNPFSQWSYMCPSKYNLFLRKLLRKTLISNVLSELINYIDYFCFWNYYDYELLQREFHTNIKFKYFAYSANYNSVSKDEPLLPKFSKQNQTIMLNHQASITGNHNTIMDKVARLDKDNLYTKICPLSYGSSYLRKSILKKGRHIFGDKFMPILNYMSRDDYFKMISSVEVAILGARRQEASGNISTLLRNGVKIFLRNDNNLLQYYRDKGFLIYSFEDDLHTLNDLTPLTMEEQIHNFQCSMKNRIYYEQFMPYFFVK